MSVALHEGRDYTEAASAGDTLGALWGAITEGFSEGVAKARDISNGVTDRISALFDDAETIYVEQMPDGTGKTVFSGQKDVGDKGTSAAAPQPLGFLTTQGRLDMGKVAFTAIAGALIWKLVR